MKKILFTVLGLMIFSLNAQLNDRFRFELHKGQELKIRIRGGEDGPSAKRASASGWFDYVGAYDDFNGSGLGNANFVAWIQPDTNIGLVSTTNERFKIGYHVVGRVNDPRDEVFENNPHRFSRHTNYSWDSIRFVQFYIRNEDSMKVGSGKVYVVDTVFIQYFLSSGLDNMAYSYANAPTINYYYSCPKRNSYNKKTKLNSAAFKTDTILLTGSWADVIDDNTVTGRMVTANPGATITQDPKNVNANLIAHTITFKPMKPTKLGDTGLAFNNQPIFNRHNMYGLRMFAKEGLKVENANQEAQNNSIITNFEVGYGQTPSIFKSYLPGSVFSNTIFEATAYFITSNNVSVNTVDASGNGLGNIYPNPSSGAIEILVPVRMSTAHAVTFKICDITGKIIKTIATECEAGDSDIAISTLDLNAGLYTCTMVAGEFKATARFVVN
jgi:hypothetical protein